MAQPRLFQSSDVEEQWLGVVRPWLQDHASDAWRSPAPAVVLTPSRAESFYFRGRWVEEGGSLLGLHFWTPSDARRHLLAPLPLDRTLVRDADFQLLARLTAGGLSQNSHENTLASVVREPRSFLRAFEALQGAGWNPAKDGPAYGRKLARELQRCLAERQLMTQPESHHLLFATSARHPTALLGPLLVSGFNAAHWPLWDLLRAATRFSSSATVSLMAPRVFAESVDELWIGSWEEFAGQPVEVAADAAPETSAPFAPWIKSYEIGNSGAEELRHLTFLVTSRLRTQTEAIVLQALTFLEMKTCRRLGIIFPEGSGLASGVAAELQRLGLPVDDGIGQIRPGPFETRAWSAWLALQEEPSVTTMIAFARAVEAEGAAPAVFPRAREIARALDSALAETLIDHLGFLRLHLEASGKKKRVVEFMQAHLQLPGFALFRDFHRLTQESLAALGWGERLPLTQMAAPPWLGQLKGEISRSTFLSWLREVTDSRATARGPEGNHYYGKIHLLHYAHLPGQTWTHLILTGLNEGVWPRVAEAGTFGSRYELEQLNRSARNLNRRGVVEGAQGAGHASVREDRGHCLLPLERRDLSLRDLCAAIEATREAVCLCALTGQGGRPLLPSDFFLHAYRRKTGSTLDEMAFGELALHTEQETARHQSLSSSDNLMPDLAEMERAYLVRRDPTQPYRGFEFSYAEPPPEPVQMPCKAWETAWLHPDSIWLERIIGVAPWPNGDLSWPLATGIWVHRWLASALRGVDPADAQKDFVPRLRAAAEAERRHVEGLVEKAGARMHPWWAHVWAQASSIALSLGEELAPQLRDRLFLAEFALPSETRVALPGATHPDFNLRGQVDLLLIDSEIDSAPPGTHPDFANTAVWIIDFKTGSVGKLTDSRLEKGDGLQAMLYALALERAGAAAVALSLQTADTSLRQQAQLSQVRNCTALFRSLDRMHRQGVFGQRPKKKESDYGHNPALPMATRPIPADVMEAKWALTHGAAVGNFFEES